MSNYFYMGLLCGATIGILGYKGCSAIINHSKWSVNGTSIDKTLTDSTDSKETKVYIKTGLSYDDDILLYLLEFDNDKQFKFRINHKDGTLDDYFIDITKEGAEKHAKYWQERMKPYLDNVNFK